MDYEISRAWALAATDLGIRVLAPFTLTDATGGPVLVEAYVPDFGGPQGTLAISLDDDSANVVVPAGYYLSKLGSGYRIYDRRSFVDILNDWGWFGDKNKRPIWYSGEHWG